MKSCQMCHSFSRCTGMFCVLRARHESKNKHKRQSCESPAKRNYALEAKSCFSKCYFTLKKCLFRNVWIDISKNQLNTGVLNLNTRMDGKHQHEWTVEVCGQRGGNTVCAAINHHGVVHQHATFGPYGTALDTLHNMLIPPQQTDDPVQPRHTVIWVSTRLMCSSSGSLTTHAFQ